MENFSDATIDMNAIPAGRYAGIKIETHIIHAAAKLWNLDLKLPGFLELGMDDLQILF